MKEELIKFVMEKADKCYSDDFPIPCIEEWIREFFDVYYHDCDLVEVGQRKKKEN
jgi:hypothetical protein